MRENESFKPITSLRTPEDFLGYAKSFGVSFPFLIDRSGSGQTETERPSDILGRPFPLSSGLKIGNRFAVLPMEGWDGTSDGRPGELTYRRWKRFGRSGAKLIWGGEAVAVRHNGRANPNQLLLTAETMGEIESLRECLLRAHTERFGGTGDLVTGLQLTHSGRFSRPNEKTRPEPLIAYRHPILDELFGMQADHPGLDHPGLDHPVLDHPVLTDRELEGIAEDFIQAAVRVWKIGFDFVDVKMCHGYLLHELLSARTRPGRYGGSFENRTRFARNIIAGIRRDAPGLRIGVRLSVFDYPPFRAAAPREGYPYIFGADPDDPFQIDLSEVIAFCRSLRDAGVELICTSAGSPYYNPHIQRPALFPPCDGYGPPEDPLVGVARQIETAAELKKEVPELAVVGSAYSYLQQWLPHVAAGVVREGMADFIGLGRMMFSYPDMPADILSGAPLDRKRICRTCSRCTTAPRKGHVSGCYLFDKEYSSRPVAKALR